MNSWGNFKTDKIIQWVNTVYQARVQAFSTETFIKQIEPFGGKVAPRNKQFWMFDTAEVRCFWREEIERNYGLLTTDVLNYDDGPFPNYSRLVYFRLVYQPDCIYALKSGKNNPLKRRIIDLRKKDQKYGKRRGSRA